MPKDKAKRLIVMAAINFGVNFVMMSSLNIFRAVYLSATWIN